MDKNPANSDLESAREQVHQVITRLEEAQMNLWETVEGLALPPVRVREESFDLAGVSELDAVVRCALHDHLKPLIENLRCLVRPVEENRE